MNKSDVAEIVQTVLKNMYEACPAIRHAIKSGRYDEEMTAAVQRITSYGFIILPGNLDLQARLDTEKTLHAAWRKRAEEAEAELNHRAREAAASGDAVREAIAAIRAGAEQLILSASDGSESYTDYRASKEIEDAVSVIERSLSLPAISEGWKLVPIEPTREMLRAYRNAIKISPHKFNLMHETKASIRWAAMLSVAPHPNSKSGQ